MKSVLKRLVKATFRSAGLDVRRARPEVPEAEFPFGGYDLEDEARVAIRTVGSNTMVPYARLVVLYQQAVHCERQGIPGAFVECGTWKGGASGVMALASLKYGRLPRHLHLFDSFEGIPEPNEAVDGKGPSDWARKHGADATGALRPVPGAYESVGTLDDNKNLIEKRIGYDASYVHYHRGWFQDTVPRDAGNMGPIAILRLDGDWYDSTRVCLRHLYDHVVPGGFVIVDDYNHAGLEGCKRATDEFIAERGVTSFLNHLDGDGRYWIKP